jgi:hypothetical protein
VPTPRLNRAIWTIGIAAVAVIGFQTWTRAVRPGGIDLTTYLAASRALAGGGSPYAIDAPFPYLYPAFLAFALLPATWLPEGVVLAVWFAASVLAAVWSMAAVMRLLDPALTERALTPFIGTLLVVTLPVVQSNLRNGQVNFFVLALCVVALRQHLRGTSASGGVAWAAAVATKVVPAILAVFYARRAAWHTAAIGVVATAALLAAPALIGGGTILAEQRAAAVSLLSGSFGAASGMTALDFSLGGALVAAGLPLPARWLRLIGALLVVAIVCVTDWRTPRGRRQDVAMFTLYLAAIPLVSPKSEIHHLAFVLPAMTIVGTRLWYDVPPRRAAVPWLVGAALIVYGIGLAYRPVAGLALFGSVVLMAIALVEGTEKR